MTWLTLLASPVYGVLCAWCARLLIDRVPGREPLLGPLRCGNCASALTWYEQLPLIAWLLRRARCHSCRAQLGGRQALLEAICVLMAFDVLTQSLPGITFVPWLLYIPIAMALAVIDLREKRLPDALTLPSAAGALVLLAADAAMHGLSGLLHACAGAALLFAVYFLMNLLSRGGMGMGDVKLALSIGAITGYLGWVYTVGATMLAFLAGGAVSAVLLASRRADRKGTIPFGPFMLLGAFGALPLAGLLTSFLSA